MDALEKHRNVLVDGSLRNASWYLQYFKELRSNYPIIKIAILQVEAETSTILHRAKQRALITGRVVPQELILDALKEIAHSMKVLVPHSDFYARMTNNDGTDPHLFHAEFHAKDDHIKGILSNSSDSPESYTSISDDNVPDWTLQKKEGSNTKYMLTTVKHPDGHHDTAAMTVETSTSHSQESFFSRLFHVGHHRDDKKLHTQTMIVTSISDKEIVEEVEDWQSHFTAVWVMRCAIPVYIQQRIRQQSLTKSSGNIDSSSKPSNSPSKPTSDGNKAASWHLFPSFNVKPWAAAKISP